MCGGLNDRVHDLLLCGIDPSMVDLGTCLAHLQSEEGNSHARRETEALIRAASHPWKPSHHSYYHGPEFKACIASLCLVKVKIMHQVGLALHLNLDESKNAACSRHIFCQVSFFDFFSLDPFKSH